MAVNNPNWWRENYGKWTLEDDTTDIALKSRFLKSQYELPKVAQSYEPQREELRGFTMAELVDVDVFSAGPEDNVRQNNLQNKIFQAFAKRNWETTVPPGYERKNLYQLGRDSAGRPRDGDWVANNPIVWRALLPCLKLASKFIENAHLFPWIDALLYGQEPVSETSQENSQAARIIFRTRKVFDPKLPDSRLRPFLSQVAGNLRMGLCSGHHNPTTGRSSPENGTWGGVTILSNYDQEQKSRIYLAYEIIEPLLRSDIKPSTLLALQFHVAVTVVHEFMHVLAHNTQGPIDKYVDTKPEPDFYFESEAISEVGISFETAVFGAYTVLVLRKDEYLDSNHGIQAGILMEDWFSKQQADRQTASNLINFEGVIYRPVSISFVEDLGQEDFWKYMVSTWGAQALKIYPLNEGRRVYQFRGAYRGSERLPAPNALPAWVSSVQNLNSSGMLNPEMARVIELTKRRIDRSANTMSKRVTRERIESMAKGDYKPWNIRLRRLKWQHEIADKFTMGCQEHVGKVESWVSVLDKKDRNYPKVRAELARENVRHYKLCREWLNVALGEDIYDRFSVLKALYEGYHDVLGIKLTGESPYAEAAVFNSAIHNHCAQLLEKARSYSLKNNKKLCRHICKEVLRTPYASTGNLADGNLLLASATTPEFKVWYAAEAVRLYWHKLTEDGDNDNISVSDATKKSLDYARKTLEAARGDPRNYIPPTLRSNNAGPTSSPLMSRRGKRIREPKARSEADPAAMHQASHSPGPNLSLSSPQWDFPHYNQQLKYLKEVSGYFKAANFEKAESAVLQLMALPDLAPRVRAECHMCLACIPSRRDCMSQARSGWLRFKELEATALGEEAAGVKLRLEKVEEQMDWLKRRSTTFDDKNGEKKSGPKAKVEAIDLEGGTDFRFRDNDAAMEDKMDSLSDLHVTDEEDMSPLTENERRDILAAAAGIVGF